LGNSLFFFITGLLFLTGDNGELAGELASAQVNLSSGPPPGNGLLIHLSHFLIPVPLGSIYFRIALLNLIIGSLSIYHFFKLTQEYTENNIISTACTMGLGFSLLFFRTSLFITPLPLSLLFILLFVRFITTSNILKDPRYILLFAFIMGIGITGLHPTVRFLFPPLVLLWLFSYRVNKTIFLTLPFFFLLGFCFSLFIPLTLSREVQQWENISGFSSIFKMLSSKALVDFHGSRIMSTHSFVWWPDFKRYLFHIFDNFPPFLIPFVIAGLFPFNKNSDHKRYYAFLGMGAAEFVYGFWMAPEGVRMGIYGHITLATLWLSCAAGIGKICQTIKANSLKLLFPGVLSIIIIPSVLLLDHGEKWRTGTNHSGELISFIETSLPYESTILVNENVYKQLIAGKIIEGVRPDIKLIPVSRKKNLNLIALLKKKNIFITPGTLKLPEKYYLLPKSPILGIPVYIDDFRVMKKSEINNLLKKIIKFGRGDRLRRIEAATLLINWGNEFLNSGQVQAASKFSYYSLNLVPLLPEGLFLKSKIDFKQQRYIIASKILDKLFKLDGSIGDAFLLKSKILRTLVIKGYLKDSLKLKYLRRGIDFAKKSLILKPENRDTFFVMAEIYFDLGEFKLSKKYVLKTLKIDPDFKNAVLLNSHIFKLEKIK
jgi:tetratricopeptide (TPR) repeat protein